MSQPRKPQLPKHRSAGPALRTAGDPAVQAARVQRLVGEGSRLLTARRPGEAVAILQEALALDPRNVAAAVNLGGAFVLQGQHALAVPVLEAAAAWEPDNAMIWSNLAAAYLGKLPFATTEPQERAIAAYRRALSLDPLAPHIYYNLGLIYLERDDLEQAAACFLGALETDPSDRDALVWLNKIRNPTES